jgi:hypothetical protein
MKYWTLKINGAEKVLADGTRNWPADHWGICADLEGRTAAKTKGSVTARTIEDFDAGAPQFAYDAKVIIYRDRDLVSGAFSGGTPWFQGYVGKPQRSASDGRENISYVFYDPWWKFERLTFKQTRNIFNGYTTPSDPRTPPTYRQEYTSEIYIGEKPDETYQTNGQQVVEILNWVNECWNPTRRGAVSGIDASQDVIQIGTIDPAVNIPKSRIVDPKCAEALVNVLRWSPDAVPFFDHTTTPPTIHVRALANLPEVVITITAEDEKEITVTAENDRQLAGVFIKYKKNATVDGVIWPNLYPDKHPAGITDFTPDVSDHTIELAGSNTAHTVQEVIVLSALDAISGSATTRKAFWLNAIKELQDPDIDPASITADVATVTAESGGGAVSLAAYPNILVKGAISDWMGVNWIDATIAVNIGFERYVDPPTGGVFRTKSSKQVHKVSHKVTLTNAVTRVNPNAYFFTSFDSGDPVPIGVAQSLYNSVATLQHSGTLNLTREQMRTDISVGCKLKAIGPTQTFSNLLVQEVTSRPNFGTTREIDVCVDGVAKKMIVLCSLPYAAP